MKKNISILDRDEEQILELAAILSTENYNPISHRTVPDMQNCLHNKDCKVVIIDIDNVPLDNRTIRALTIKNPGAYFLCLSKDRFHPELREALCYHIFACIKKPVDPDELFYWLKSIFNDNPP